MKENIIREITPLKETDCFLVFDRFKNDFNFPIHYHPEYELNFILNAKGALRMVGDHHDNVDEAELVLIGPKLYHCWMNGNINREEQIHEITIQFPVDLFGDELLKKNVMRPIRDLLHNSYRGIAFSRSTIDQVKDKLVYLSKRRGFDSFLELQSLLFDLANSRDQRFLTNISFQNDFEENNGKNIDMVYQYINQNYQQKLKLEDAAELINMSVVSFTRLMKQRTGKSFVEFVNEVRIGYATRMLIDSNKSVAEICFDCGFNNLSNFNRIFKKRQSLTPTEFRNSFVGVRNVY
ncbi:MAG: helix-turn-helix domain-containing protein [Breznakibacter sp.]